LPLKSASSLSMKRSFNLSVTTPKFSVTESAEEESVKKEDLFESEFCYVASERTRLGVGCSASVYECERIL
jgi:hypothetical protein